MANDVCFSRKTNLPKSVKIWSSNLIHLAVCGDNRLYEYWVIRKRLFDSLRSSWEHIKTFGLANLQKIEVLKWLEFNSKI